MGVKNCILTGPTRALGKHLNSIQTKQGLDAGEVTVLANAEVTTGSDLDKDNI